MKAKKYYANDDESYAISVKSDSEQVVITLHHETYGDTDICLDFSTAFEFCIDLNRKLPNTKPKSTQEFESLCSITFNVNRDYWQFKYKGVLEFEHKSKFQCMVAQKQLQNELGL